MCIEYTPPQTTLSMTFLNSNSGKGPACKRCTQSRQRCQYDAESEVRPYPNETQVSQAQDRRAPVFEVLRHRDREVLLIDEWRRRRGLRIEGPYVQRRAQTLGRVGAANGCGTLGHRNHDGDLLAPCYAVLNDTRQRVRCGLKKRGLTGRKIWTFSAASGETESPVLGDPMAIV